MPTAEMSVQKHKNIMYYSVTPLQRTPLGPTTVSTIARVSLAQGLVVDHAPPTIVANYDKARLWTTKKNVLRCIKDWDRARHAQCA